MTGWLITTPRIAALHCLEQRFGTPDHAPAPVLDLRQQQNRPDWRLADWQVEAVARAEPILRRRGGVLIADSVGLGKTHVGAALLRSARARGLNCVIITPTPLRAHWRRTVKDDAVQIVTHAQLSRSSGPNRIHSAQFVVVDEAHAFRSAHTRRYRVLHAMRGRAELVLLTATPVNNSATDLLNLLLLFARDGTFRDIGVPGLTSAFRAGDTAAITRVLADTTIRRARAFVRRNHGPIADPNGRSLRFPEREDPVAVRYDLGGGDGRPWLRALDDLQHLEFPWLRTGTRELLRLNLLKRLESGTLAFATSLESLAGFIDAHLDAAAAGQSLSPADYRRFFNGLTDQFIMRDVLLHTHREHTVDTPSMRRDRNRIQSLLHAARETRDPKLDALRSVLRSETGVAPVIVFTAFRDTARHLWRVLHTEFRTAMIDAGAARLGATHASRAAILRALSPDTRVHKRERVDLLIATDVLSEGLDLHAARTVVSYDLPWNPIRLVQRVGRIDRPGSPHETIRIINFIPDRGLDRLLDLLNRIRGKLDAIRSTIGLESPVLDRADVDPDALRAVLHRLAAGDVRVLDDEPTDAQALSEQLYQEWQRARGKRDQGDDAPCAGPDGGTPDLVAVLAGSTSVFAKGGRWFVLQDSAVAEDTVVALRVLTDALNDSSTCDADPDLVTATLERFRCGCAALELVESRTSATTRATRMLLAGAPHLSGTSDLVRIESVIRRLRNRLSPVGELGLDNLLSKPPDTPQELLDRLEDVTDTATPFPVSEPWILLLGGGARVG